MKELPEVYYWFIKLNLLKFPPWNITSELESFSTFNSQFRKECPKREVITFAHRKDMDTFAGFEVINKKPTDKIIVFNLTFTNNKNWDIIENEYDDFFGFMSKNVLHYMKDWIADDDINDYN